MSCETNRELLEQYALGLLDEDERESVAAHVASCAECAARVSEYERLLAALPEALALASPLTLPTELKGRVVGGLDAPVGPEAPGPRLAARPAPSGRRVPIVRVALAVVGAFAAISAAACGVALDRERTIRERYGDLYDDQELVLEIVDSSRTERTLLRALDEGSPAYGKLFTNPERREIVVMAARLRPVDDDERYRVWLLQGTRALEAGTLKVNDRGFGLLVFTPVRRGLELSEVRVVLQQESETTPAGETVLSSVTQG